MPSQPRERSRSSSGRPLRRRLSLAAVVVSGPPRSAPGSSPRARSARASSWGCTVGSRTKMTSAVPFSTPWTARDAPFLRNQSCIRAAGGSVAPLSRTTATAVSSVRTSSPRAPPNDASSRSTWSSAKVSVALRKWIWPGSKRGSGTRRGLATSSGSPSKSSSTVRGRRTPMDSHEMRTATGWPRASRSRLERRRGGVESARLTHRVARSISSPRASRAMATSS